MQLDGVAEAAPDKVRKPRRVAKCHGKDLNLRHGG